MNRKVPLGIGALSIVLILADAAAAPEPASRQEFCADYPDWVQACFTPPTSGWTWKSTHDGAYVAMPPGSSNAIRVERSGVKVSTREAVAAQLGRILEGSPETARLLVVEPSSVPGPESFRFTYEGPANGSPKTKTIGYVTASDWMVAGIFESGHESSEFVQFVRSYHERRHP
jgi:hypothetical protein